MVDLAALNGYLDHLCTAPVSAINAGYTQLRIDSTAVSERENAFLSLMQRDRMAAGIFHGCGFPPRRAMSTMAESQDWRTIWSTAPARSLSTARSCS
jgi:hypothetical protein